MKLSDYIIDFLEKKKIEKIFFVPGGGCMHLVDSLGQRRGIEGINLLHEQGVAIATESYAFSKGEVGVALVTTGPGGTNAVTGVLSAYLDSIPCIFISGQVKTSDLKRNFGVRSHGSQEADIVTIVKEITKYAVMVESKEDIRYYLEKAWYEATNGRKGPVWIDVPLDIQGSHIEPDQLKGYEAPIFEKVSFKVEAEEILSRLKISKRPIIIAGNGIRGYEKFFYELIDKLGVPVIPTWKAVDLIANDHPLFAGKCGTLGERASNFAMQTADLLISFGSKLDFSITGFDRIKWATNAKKIVVDIDETEINKLQVPLELKVIGNVGDLIQTINSMDFNLPSYENWKNRISHWLKKYPIGYEKVEANRETEDGTNMAIKLISTYQLVDEVCNQIDKNTVIVPASAGTVAEICYQDLKIKQGQKVRSNHGLGAMGYELPAAIGAFFATGKQIATFAGDGGMQLNIQELAIIAGRKLPIKIFVVNNGGYSSIRNMQRNHFEGRYVGSNEETGLYLPDMEILAKAYGIKGLTIKKPEELSTIIKEVFSDNEPVICNVEIDPFCIVSPRSTSKVMADGKMVSTPLEDLFPFLDEEELKRELDVSDI